MVSVEQSDYIKILELDEYVRCFGVPAILDDATSHSMSPRFLVMQRGLVALSREIGKLNILLDDFLQNAYQICHSASPTAQKVFHGSIECTRSIVTPPPILTFCDCHLPRRLRCDIDSRESPGSGRATLCPIPPFLF